MFLRSSGVRARAVATRARFRYFHGALSYEQGVLTKLNGDLVQMEQALNGLQYPPRFPPADQRRFTIEAASGRAEAESLLNAAKALVEQQQKLLKEEEKSPQEVRDAIAAATKAAEDAQAKIDAAHKAIEDAIQRKSIYQSFAESAIGKFVAGAVLLFGVGATYLTAAHYCVGPKTVSESAIRERAVRKFTNSSFTLPESHPSKRDPSFFVERLSTKKKLRERFETSERGEFWVCVGSKASGKTSLIQEVAHEAKNLSVVYLRTPSSRQGMISVLNSAMGISDLVDSNGASLHETIDRFIRSIATAAEQCKKTEGLSHIVVVFDDLNSARGKEEIDYYSEVQRFLRDLCLLADVVVIGAVSSASDVAYMQVEPRRSYHKISNFTDDELKEYIGKRGFSDECATEIVKHYMPPIGFVKPLLNKLPPDATKDIVAAAIDAERKILAREWRKETMKCLMKILEAGGTLGIGEVSDIFGEDITEPNSRFFKLIMQNRMLVWDPTARTLSLAFPIQREAVKERLR